MNIWHLITMASIFKKKFKRSSRIYALAQSIYPFTTLISAVLRGRRGGWDHLRSTWSMITRSTFVAGLPVNITIEPTNACNLRCPVCETGSNEIGRPLRHMTLIEFQAIIKKIACHTNTLLFYFMGEPFLNRDAYQMIQAAKKAGIPWVTTCTNGDVVDPEQLVLSGIDEVSFQIGGISQETHSIYRVNGGIERVLHNMRETVRLRRKYGIKLRVVCGMILMRHNEHEVGMFKQVMSDMGVDEAIIVDPCVRTVAQGKLFLPSDERHWYYDPNAFRSGILRPKIIRDNRCDWIYYSMVIQANGDIVPCCRDPKGEYVMGNILNQNLEDIWNGESYRAFRYRVLNNKSEMSLCRICSGYPASSLK